VITPVAAGDTILNTVIAFDDDNGAGAGVESLPPPLQAEIIMHSIK
jgi:hypothetical protein